MNNVILGGGCYMVRGNGQHVYNSHFLLDSKCHEAKDRVVRQTLLTTELKGLAQSKQPTSCSKKVQVDG